MAKAKFGLNDILNAKSRAAAAGRVEDYEEIYLSPYEVKAAPENTHQSLENIEELEKEKSSSKGNKSPC